MAIELGKNRVHGPDEHSSIPIKVAAAHKSFGKIRIGLFPETDYFKETGILQRFSPFNIAVSRTRPCWSDANRDEVAQSFRRFRRALQIFLKRRSIGDPVIRGQHGHRGSWTGGGDAAHSESNRCGGIALRWLRDDIVFRMVGKDFTNGRLLVLIG